MSGGFFRGTSADQDARFSNKQAKLLKTQKFAPELEHLVNVAKVKMDVIKPWIATRVTELLGFEDEVLINFIYGLLDGKVVNGKEVQIQITGFMEKNTGKFMKELWSLLLSAQRNASGVPQQFLDAKEEETRKKKDEADRIANEIQKKRDKEIREFEEERSRKMDAGAETRTREDGRDRASKHVPSKSPGVNHEDDRGADEMNGARGRKRFSGSPGSSDRRSLGRGRHRSRSPSRSPIMRGRSISSERGFRSRSPQKHSITHRRKHSPQRSFSPPRRSPYSMRRSRSRSHRSSPSPARRRLQSPYRRRSPSPLYRRSPSPPRRRRRSPSPVRRRRSPSPVRRRRSPSPARRRRSPSPVRRRRSPSPVRWRRTPSPVRRRRSPSLVRRRRSPSSPSPDQYRSPGVSRRRHHESPSPRRRASLSPVESRSLSPAENRSVSPVRRRSPIQRRSHSPDDWSSQSPPARGRSPAGVKGSLRYSRSPVDTAKDGIRSCKFPPEALRSSFSARGEKNGSHSIVSPSVPSLRRSPVMSDSDRSRSYSGERREARVHKSKTVQNRDSPSVDRQREKLMKVHEEQYFDLSLTGVAFESHVHNEILESRKKDELSGISTTVEVDRRKADSYSPYARGDLKYNEKSSTHSRGIRDRDLPDRMYGSGSEESEKLGVSQERRKQKRARRLEVAYDDSNSSDSRYEERKEAKRRKKEERKLRKEEKRRRREERHRRREERHAKKLKSKSQNDDSSDGDHVGSKYHPSDGETESEKRRLEIELRNKALESLKAKKGMSP